MLLTVKTRTGKSLIQKLELAKDDQTATVDDVCQAIHAKIPKFTPSRQRLTFGDNAVLQKGTPLSKYNVKDGDTIIFKDLGLQISWTAVFVLEYLGPILIHPLFYFFPQLFYTAAPAPRTTIQNVTLILTVLHFMKREYETLFVHRFSLETMPLMNLPKNCAHYWFFSGLLLAHATYRPGFNGGVAGGIGSGAGLYVLIGVWMYAEISNFVTHLTLRNLRPPGSKVRNIPHGYGFALVACPNYLFEALGWVSLSLINGSAASWLFTALGTWQMYVWAVKKHDRYKKEFGLQYPRGRKAMFPFIA
ncbi:hypothetical protein SeMB42_g03147 [Synchytrium endobioticum]|uniref:Ubiquitin-like domain-containing protein n=1 Tax=Synchytrium endobioticum TaxID=286115 RepID=A0A507D5E5_9FUNG|nr:hypothetical protein SeLEV6574_g03194 [Synchytrium endobioticum]TPX48001.1 hypothetical protein SeMB42_g03147 [Synchytrium endobioticum]